MYMYTDLNELQVYMYMYMYNTFYSGEVVPPHKPYKHIKCKQYKY